MLARVDAFADALAGTALLHDAPLLLTGGATLDGRAAAELDRVLADGDTVYLLGGTGALSSTVAQQVADRGFRVVRLAGASRVETAVAVATEAQRLSGRREVLLARAYGPAGDPTAAWADSVAAGGLAATLGVPVVITPGDRMHPAVAAFLARTRPTRTVVLGGAAALSTAVEQAAPKAVRVAGADRTATAAALATRGWGSATTGARRFVVVNGEQPDGWTFGLAAAGLSADARAPMLLVTELVSAAVRPLVGTCGAAQVDLAVMGDGTRVSASVRERLDALDGDACGAGGALRTQRQLSAFDGCEPVLDYYRDLALERVGPWGLDGLFIAYAGGGEGAPAAEGDASGGGAVSSTNVQEVGVDEPDIVKTDGTRALAVAREGVQVVDLSKTPPVVAATIALDPGDHQLLLSGTRALVISRTYPGFPRPVEPGTPGIVEGEPFPVMGTPGTQLRLYDVSDVAAPALLASADLDGEYRSARMVDGVVRVVLQTAPGPFSWSYPEDDSASAMERSAEHNRQLIRTSTLEHWTAEYETRDAAGTLTAEGPLAPCTAISAPPRPSDLGTVTVATFDLAGGLEPTSAAAISAASDLVYASTDRLVVATQRWNGWVPDAGDQGTTELHSFDIADAGATRYVASGSVPGFLLNQFALSETDGYLRVAATEGTPWGPEPSSSSTLTVLQEQGSVLTPVGSVSGLGRGEQIYAVRFMGDLAAVVTFRQVDPLYLVDLSRPTAPTVVGELKIPGFSSYLHRLSDGLLMGVGQDADADGRILGTQVATYDISDLSRPRQVSKLTYPDSYSEVQGDHKAFLYWEPSRLAVVPLDEWRGDASDFHGAVALGVDGAGALSVRSRFEHFDGDGRPTSVRRSFVVGTRLYTVSDAGLRVDDLATLAERSFTPFR